MNSFFALLFRQKYIKRWGLMRNVSSESLSEHSAETAALAHALALIGNNIFKKNYNVEKIVCMALYHDATEVFTGDMPTPVKYFSPEMRKGYELIELQAAESFLNKLPSELKDIYRAFILPNKEEDSDSIRIVKIADKLSAYIKCLTEETSGNKEFLNARKTTEAALKKLDCPELDYFMSNFIDSFSLTLDEM